MIFSVQCDLKKCPYSATISHPSKEMIFTGQFFPSQDSWLCLRCETCSHEKTSHHRARSYYGYYVDYYASQVSRRLDVVFAGGSKPHYCHSKDHKVASLEVRGRCLRLSTGICQREQLLKNVSSLTFLHSPPPRPVGGVSIKHYLSLCGWRTLKKHPRSYITNSERRWIYCTQRNTRLHCSVFPDSSIDCNASVSYYKVQTIYMCYFTQSGRCCVKAFILTCFAHFRFILFLVCSFLKSLINHRPGIICVEQRTEDRGWLDVPQERRESQQAVQNHFAPS